MTATLKTTIIQEPSSSVANITLDSSGGVAINGVASSGLPLKGSSSGTTTLAASATASGTITLPAGTGTAAVQGVSTNIVQGTSQASTSGTAITFTGIPSWVKRITIMLQGVSGPTNPYIVLGTSGGFVTTGYTSTGIGVSNSSTTGGVSATTAFAIFNSSGTNTINTVMVLNNVSNNVWISSHTGSYSTTAAQFGGGSVSLSSALTQIKIQAANGTDTFTAGSINILYE